MSDDLLYQRHRSFQFCVAPRQRIDDLEVSPHAGLVTYVTGSAQLMRERVGSKAGEWILTVGGIDREVIVMSGDVRTLPLPWSPLPIETFGNDQWLPGSSYFWFLADQPHGVFRGNNRPHGGVADALQEALVVMHHYRGVLPEDLRVLVSDDFLEWRDYRRTEESKAPSESECLLRLLRLIMDLYRDGLVDDQDLERWRLLP